MLHHQNTNADCANMLNDLIINKYWAFDTTNDTNHCVGLPPIAFTAPFKVNINNTGWVNNGSRIDAYNYILNKLPQLKQ